MAHDSAVKLFQWRGRVSQKEFRKEFMAAVTEAVPLSKCIEADDDLEFRIEGLDQYKEVNISLHRAFAEFEKDPGARAEILERWLRSTEHVWQPPRPLDPADIVPMIHDRSWLEAQVMDNGEMPKPGSADSFWYDDYNEELIVVYAVHRNTFTYTQRSTLLEAGITDATIQTLAIENLRRRTPDRSITRLNDVWMVNVGGNFEASLLVDDYLWDDPRFAAEMLLAAVPERDGLLATTDTSAQAVWNLASMASHGARTQPYPITSRVLVRVGGKFELLDPDDHDEDHPIPALDVIDIETEMANGRSRFVIVIATALGADPRSVFRLFRKIDLLLDHFASARRSKENAELEINIHPDSDPAIFALLAAIPSYVSGRGANLIVARQS